MNNKIFTIITLLLLSIGSFRTNGQVNVTLNVENQSVVGTEFFFDIYITATSAPSNPLYLGAADFVLTFNSAAFTSPSFSRESSSNWVLVSSSANPVGVTYRLSTSTAAITSNELIINLAQVAFGDQSEFDDFVAKIDNQTNTHKFGRYKVTGITNPSASMNLQWKTTGSGVVTQVFTLQPTSPWTSSATNLNAVNPSDQPLPVELSSFSVNSVEGTKAQLQWETATEVNNYGFEIERTIVVEEKDAENEWEMVAFVEGHGNSNSPKIYSFTDKNLVGGSKFMYRLKQIDIDGTFEYTDAVEVEVLPTKYELFQNYPNPFNPSTNIKFSLPEDTKLAINIYNLLGERVATVLNEELKAGFHEIEFNGNSAGYSLASGVYIYSIESNNFSQVKKMILMK